MKAWLLAITAGLFGHAASAACKLPPAPGAPPSGATATREQILAAQQAIKSYTVEVAAYSKCVQEEGGDEAHLKQVIKQLEVLAEQFNEELRAFKRREAAK